LADEAHSYTVNLKDLGYAVRDDVVLVVGRKGHHDCGVLDGKASHQAGCHGFVLRRPIYVAEKVTNAVPELRQETC